MIGERYNSWTIIGFAEDRVDGAGKHHKRVICRCDCGKLKEKDLYKVKHGAKMCKDCYLKQLPNNGVPFERKENKYDLSGEYGVGWVCNAEQEFYFDLEDYDKIKDYCWHLTKGGYIRATIYGDEKKNVMMHQLLVGVGSDHINRVRHDNRKGNLRLCSQTDNTKNRTIGKNNTSGVIGVSLNKRNGKFSAYINCEGRRMYLGEFINKEDAIKARLKAEKELFGEYSSQRYLYEKYDI